MAKQVKRGRPPKPKAEDVDAEDVDAEDVDDAEGEGGAGREPEREENPERPSLRKQTVEIPGLPPGVRAWVKNQPWREFEHWVYVYKEIPDPENPRGPKKWEFQLKVPGNSGSDLEVDESFCQEHGIWGRIKTRIVWYPKRGQKAAIDSEAFFIAKPNSPSPSPLSAEGDGAPALGPSVQGAGVASLSAIAAINDLKPIVEALRGLAEAFNGGRMAAAVEAPADKGSIGEVFLMEAKKRMESALEYERKAMDKMYQVKPTGAEKTGLDKLIEEFMPLLKAKAADLLGGGPVSAAYKALISADPVFKQIWGNPEEKAKAAQAILSALPGDSGVKVVELLESIGT